MFDISQEFERFEGFERFERFGTFEEFCGLGLGDSKGSVTGSPNL
jgi:hypothetical protein